MTWFGVVNPTAGRRGSRYDEVLSISDELNLDATFRESTSASDLKELVTSAREEGQREFISVGGDGTASLVLNALMEVGGDDRCVLGMVPSGSGSDFSRTFGHDRTVIAALERISEPDLYPVDVGRVEGTFGRRYFLNALNLGVAAASVERAERLPRWVGSAKYTTAFWIALWGFNSGAVVAEVDDHRFEDKAINVVVANGQFFGGGLNIAPRSVLGDGEMDVQVFRGPRRQAFSIMPRILIGTHLTNRGVKRFSGSVIKIEVRDDWPVEADGELIGSGSVAIDVLPEAVDIVI